MIRVKKCSTCKQFFELVAFSKDCFQSDGLDYRCRACKREKNKKRKSNPERIRELRHARAAVLRTRRKGADPEKKRSTREPFVRPDVYGLNLGRYNDILDAQRDCCAACGRGFRYESRHDTPHIDHDHVTGAVRGLLCGGCNLAIGCLKDSALRALAAAHYLQGAQT